MKRLLLSVLGIAASFGAAHATTVVLDDTFTEASRTGTINAPTSTPWWNSGSPASQLTLNTAAHILDYLPNSSPLFGSIPIQTLAVNSSLTLSLTFTVIGNTTATASGLRLGLFNAGGNPVGADGTGQTNAMYQTYAGYGAFVDLGAASSNTSQIVERISNASPALFTSGASVQLGTTTGAAPDLSAGTPYTLTLQITRDTATKNTVTLSVNGVTFSDDDSVGITTSFDTVALFGSVGSASKISFSEIQVSYDAVPEPPAAALVGAAALLLLAATRLRSARARA